MVHDGMQVMLTLCNKQMGVAMEIIFIPARFARSFDHVYHREHNVLYTIFGERARSASGLTHIFTWGHGGIANDSQ